MSVVGKDFVIKLIELTKEKKIAWKYLDGESKLNSALNLSAMPKNSIPAIFGTMDIKIYYNPANSFCVKINGNYVVLLANSNDMVISEGLQLLLVPGTYKDIDVYEDDKELLVHLLMVIKSMFPNASNIVDDVLSM